MVQSFTLALRFIVSWLFARLHVANIEGLIDLYKENNPAFQDGLRGCSLSPQSESGLSEDYQGALSKLR
jgi:hypothetical protein